MPSQTLIISTLSIRFGLICLERQRMWTSLRIGIWLRISIEEPEMGVQPRCAPAIAAVRNMGDDADVQSCGWRR